MSEVTGVTDAYVRPPIKTYTDACEAPQAFWAGAIPLRKVPGPNGAPVMQRTYSHPPEVAPSTLQFRDINSMYCIGNDQLASTFAEGIGGKVSQLMVPGHPRGFLFRRQSYLLNQYIDKLSKASVAGINTMWPVLQSLTGNRPGFIVDGDTGTGKSALMAQAVHFARSRDNFLTVYIPNAKDWTHGEWCWPSVLVPGFWDAPDAARNFLGYFARSQANQLRNWPLKVTPKDLPVESGQNEQPPTTLYELCEWGAGHRVGAPANVDRQSVALKFLLDELLAETTKPILFVVDGMNLLSMDTHYRFPHPDFWASKKSTDTDIDLHPQELPRIPAARLSLMRGLNKMMLDSLSALPSGKNKFFITSTTRDNQPFDGGVSGFPHVEHNPHARTLDEYAPFHPEKDTVLHPLAVGNFDEYEYRSFLRFLINSGELAGLGWGPMWHFSSSFERKLHKIEFLSNRNPQRVVDHYHAEITWLWEYERVRQKQGLLARNTRRALMNAQRNSLEGNSASQFKPRSSDSKSRQANPAAPKASQP